MIFNLRQYFLLFFALLCFIKTSTIFVAPDVHIDKLTAAGIITPVRAPQLPQSSRPPLSPLIETPSDPSTATAATTTKKPKKTISLQIDTSKCCRKSETYATSFCRQLSLLLMRTFLILWRDRSLTAMRLLIHFCIAILIGTIYIGIGNDATNAFNNFRYIFFSIMFLMFTAFSSMTLACTYITRMGAIVVA